MSRDEPNVPDQARAAPMRTYLVIGILAFLIGVAAMATLVRFADGWAPAPAKRAPATAPAEAPAPDTSTTPAAAQGADLTTLEAREQRLADRLDRLEEALAATEANAYEASKQAGAAEALLTAFAARRALDRGVPLGYLERQLHARFGASEPGAVMVVLRTADEPVTLEDLRLALDAIAQRLLSAGSGESWWDAIRREIAGLVTVREDTTPNPRPTERLERAQRMLAAGQVEAALGEVARLPGADNAPRWITAAKRYVEARQALDTLEAAAIQGRSADPEPGEPLPALTLSDSQPAE